MIPLSRRTLLRATLSTGAAAGIVSKAAAQASDRFAALEASTGARIGVAGLDTGSGTAIRHRADERFPLCSTFKLLAVSAILHRVATEPGLLQRSIEVPAQNLVVYSPITSQHAGQPMTVAAICAAALQYSDNTAANLMLSLLGGPAAVTAFARSIGDEQFRLDRWETALNTAIPGDPRDTSTPGAMMTALQRATLGDLLAPPERDQLVTWMRGCTTGDKRIRSVVPAGSLVADKTGSGDYGTANDIAVVWPPGGAPVVLAIYTAHDDKTAAPRDDLIAETARIVLAALR